MTNQPSANNPQQPEQQPWGQQRRWEQAPGNAQTPSWDQQAPQQPWGQPSANQPDQ
ncbi:hypothetical protein [Aestuariimicrobium kwangyangense]|uniref:hypothetical protein n=1 Tax=Aestuariimicrobium kwangyangense TaxID=396389 RepID=UPI0003B562F0|nr:hypothetical protein [Aestuariimicrobium kwangyangense]